METRSIKTAIDTACVCVLCCVCIVRLCGFIDESDRIEFSFLWGFYDNFIMASAGHIQFQHRLDQLILFITSLCSLSDICLVVPDVWFSAASVRVVDAGKIALATVVRARSSRVGDFLVRGHQTVHFRRNNCIIMIHTKHLLRNEAVKALQCAAAAAALFLDSCAPINWLAILLDVVLSSRIFVCVCMHKMTCPSV
jgi:hypothetical protein